MKMNNKEVKKIYMVVCLQRLTSPLGSITWAWFSDFETAEKCVLENWTDLFENGHYEYAVIEEAFEGFGYGRAQQHWYKAIYVDANISRDPRIVKIDKPKELKNIVHFW